MAPFSQWVKLAPSRSLCGTTPAEFEALVERLEPLAVALKIERENREGRQRAPGAGRPSKPFRLRLLVALTLLRQGLTLRPTGEIFGIDEKSVRNWRDEIIELLQRHGIERPGGGAPIRTIEDLTEYLRDDERVALIDGVLVDRNRPGGDWEAQKPAYSGKSHRHSHKATVVTDEDGAPLWFEANPNGEGRTHDLMMLRAQTGLLAALGVAWLVLGDRGYQGLQKDIGVDRVATPDYQYKRSGRRPLDDGDRAYNHDQASIRVRVEHHIAGLKRWRGFRYHRRPVTIARNTFNETGKAITVLVSVLR